MQHKTNSSLNPKLISFYVIITLTFSLLYFLYYINIYQNKSIPLINSLSKTINHHVNSIALSYNKLLDNYITDKHFTTEHNNIVNLSVKRGDTIMSILKNNGIDNNEAHKVVASLKELYNLKKLFIGQQIEMEFNNEIVLGQNNEELTNHKLQLFRINVDYDKNIEIIRKSNDEFISKAVTIPLKKYITRIRGVIDSSLMATTSHLGIPNEALLELVKAYSYDVDFQRDIQVGDEIDVVFERYYNNKGEHSHNGAIIYASLILSDKSINLYRYKSSNGDHDYYNSEGSSVRKELLRTPLNVIRISSHFGMRNHPVLGYTKMHKGIDFAAPIGTPIFAAGNGVIEEIGRKGAYGNYIRIKHGNGYSTAYAHASSFAKNLRKGSPVKQGDIIAYVGSTGRSTGPHLHYEVLENNHQINPLKIKLNPGIKLAGSELGKFNIFKKKIEDLTASIPDQIEIAME